MTAENHDKDEKPEKLRVREMTIDDLSEVFHLGEEIFTSEYSPSMYRTWDEYEITTLFNSDSDLCLVAERGEEIWGFALGTTVEKQHSAWKYGYLVWLGVRTGLQKGGVGDALFKELKRRMREQGVRMILIDTDADNEAGIRFFKKQGFGNIQQHVYMTLNLSPRRAQKDGQKIMSSRLEQLWQAIDPQRLRRIFLDMLDIYSPAGKEEDIQLYLEEVLRGAGFAVERQEVEEERYNLRVTMGPGEPQLYLVGHVDTVAAWDLEELGWREEEGIIHGLGSADMKGGCAAMVEAWLALATLPEAERPPVGLLLVVGEEENGDGSAAFLETEKPPWVVIGEPTGLAACFAHYGYLEAGFVTRGRRIHSSLPELGHNAVESMLRVLLHLGKDPLFDRESSGVNYSIREMSSARAGFVVPDRCEAWIDLHLPPDIDPATIEEAIRQRAASAGEFITDLDLEVSFDFSSRGYFLGADNPLGALLEQACPKLGVPLRYDAFRSHSDGNLFYKAGVNPLILGPGYLETAHTPDEQTPLLEVIAAAKVYVALCLGVSGEAGRLG